MVTKVLEDPPAFIYSGNGKPE